MASTGFDSIEIAAMPTYHGAPDQLTPADRQEVRQLVSDSGLQIGALMGLPNPDPKKSAEQNAWVEQMLQLAHDLSPQKPPIIQSVLGGGEWMEKRSIFRDVLGSWTELARKAGIRLAIKPHRGQAMSLPEHAIWLFEQLKQQESLCMVYDPSHFVFRGLDLQKTVQQSLRYTGYIVLKDAVEQDGKVNFALPGESRTMPHVELLRQFIEGGYRGEVCSEVSSMIWRQAGYDCKQATEVCFQNLSSIVDKASVGASPT